MLECYGTLTNIQEETFSLANGMVDDFYLPYNLLVKYSQVKDGIFL